MHLMLLIINVLLRLVHCLAVNLIGLLNILIHLMRKQCLRPSVNTVPKIVIRWLVARNRNLWLERETSWLRINNKEVKIILMKIQVDNLHLTL